MTRMLIGRVLVLVFVLGAAATSSSRAAKKTLKLPVTLYRYANVELPPHLHATGAEPRQHPGGQPAH